MERMLAQRQADRAHRKARSTVLLVGLRDMPREVQVIAHDKGVILTSPQTKNRLM